MIDYFLSNVLDDGTKELSAAQRKMLRERFTQNLYATHDVEYTEYALIIKSERCYKNWLYYAGLEYVNSESVTLINDRGEFLAAFWADGCDRVARIIESLVALDEEE